MTGLVVGKDKIIEVAAIITDKDLTPLDEGFVKVIHCSEGIMNNMDAWCTEHHGNVSHSAKGGKVILVRINCASSCLDEYYGGRGK
jgi:oligoribonuclease